VGGGGGNRVYTLDVDGLLVELVLLHLGNARFRGQQPRLLLRFLDVLHYARQTSVWDEVRCGNVLVDGVGVGAIVFVFVFVGGHSFALLNVVKCRQGVDEMLGLI